MEDIVSRLRKSMSGVANSDKELMYLLEEAADEIEFLKGWRSSLLRETENYYRSISNYPT